MKSQSQYTDLVVDLVRGTVAVEDEALAESRLRAQERGLPLIEVAPEDGAILGFLVAAIDAKRVVEIGTLFGYSAIWMARALGPQGRIVTIEVEADHADLAAYNFEEAGVADRVEILEGRALDVLDGVTTPVDFVFIDADKESYPDYLAWARRALHPGGIVAADNAFWHGSVVDPGPEDSGGIGIRRLWDQLVADEAWRAAIIPTLGGMAVGLRTEAA